jgi:hypothetical protein
VEVTNGPITGTVVVAAKLGAAITLPKFTVTVVGVPTPFETVTGNDKLAAGEFGGVPESTPVVGFSVNQFGKVLVVVNEVAAGWPEVGMVYEPGRPAVKLGAVRGLATIGGAVAVSVTVVEALPALFAPVSVKVCTPGVVGVPVKTPLAKLKPVGRLLLDQLLAGVPPVCGKV